MKTERKPKTPRLAPPPDELPASAIEAEQAREKAWQADKDNVWNGEPLKAWTRERESLFVRLVDQDEALSGLANIPVITERLNAASQGKTSLGIEQILDAHQFIEQASLVLFLASHEPEQWDHLRGRPAAFLRAANAWAEINIPLGSEWPAIHQAVAMRTAHRQMVAVRKPQPGTGGNSGN
jgi:hypothetical protein